jgi:CelD/BcsL family acetyltransferase involved in cellulose biosynthesis
MYPFQTPEYKSLFQKHFIDKSTLVVEDTFEILANNRAVLLGMKPVLNGQEITDFGDIPQATNESLSAQIQVLKANYHATTIQFDYIREDSTLFPLLNQLSLQPPTQQEVSPAIRLPETWDQYLESLERTDRKELKRKWKRLDLIPHNFRCIDTSNTSAFEDFIRLHKLSDTAKEVFMSEKMKSFFFDLCQLTIPQWQIKFAFLDIDGIPAAAILYFENQDQILLYNSGYDPLQKYYSGGLLLAAYLIKQSIEKKKKKVDFLRGNERYKYDLGAVDNKLFQFILS